MFIMAILHNTETDRYHPIAFRRAPFPGNADATTPAQRYRSLGHHTEGYVSFRGARRNVNKTLVRGKGEIIDSGLVYGWNGKEIPAMTELFSIPEQPESLGTRWKRLRTGQALQS